MESPAAKRHKVKLRSPVKVSIPLPSKYGAPMVKKKISEYKTVSEE